MQEIKMIFTGDFCPVLRTEDLVKKGQHEALLNDILPVFRAADLRVVDLECPLITGGEKINKTGPNLKADPGTISLLTYAGVDVVAMANNHIKDYGAEGLLSTMQLCRDNNIFPLGVGKNLEEAGIPYSTTIKGKKIKILNFTENEWSNTQGEEPGANPLDPVRNFRDIQEARKDSDIVIVVFHGGNEFYELPSPRVKAMLRFFADAGATAVISHHTHVSTGFEVYHDVPIFYGLGNFCYDSENRNSQWNYGYAVGLNISEKVGFEVIPFVQSNDQPGVQLLSGEDLQSFMSRLEGLNEIIADDVRLAERFKAFCDENAFRYDQIFEPYHSRILTSLRKRGLFPSLLTNRKKRLMLNVIRCDAHRDVLLSYLNRYGK